MRVIGKKIIHLGEVDSTNDFARRLIKDGAAEGTVIIADYQSRGRGKPGRSWASPKGAGIYLSVILAPRKNPNRLGNITRIAAEAVVEVCALAGIAAKIKLPNDVLIGTKKVCGILTERVAAGQIILGIGVNVNSSADDLPDEATSFKIETDKNFDVALFTRRLLSALDGRYLAYLS